MGWILLVVAIVGLGFYWRSQRKNRKVGTIEIQVERDDIPKEYVARPEDFPHPDPLFREVAARAFNEGGMVVGHRDEDGNETIESRPFKD